MLSWYMFILLGLATFRFTRLIVFDTITNFLREPFHEVKEEVLEDGSIEEVIHIKGKGIQRFIGELLSCQWCFGVWSAAIIFVGYTLFPYMFFPIIVILALAAVASIIQVVLDSLRY
ncbi:DUF1360 domain-containing protein [Aquibacillus koreensis]|uniref:DUF1360 domain-containing protein n=1 Tax=Aquibacillus koreensis TaxID=279446 RepID=A0A9X4AJR6_9BACI|nr:DUF1360 domain-containing protein [Aquibacillus koreensis]MCT2536170.1 DUF1360 domain-containing protein [Aquibacillus koreensis]MDC3422094.1 DUF1360 domain-containing protein [Aquibacillus koreensis]